MFILRPLFHDEKMNRPDLAISSNKITPKNKQCLWSLSGKKKKKEADTDSEDGEEDDEDELPEEPGERL